MKTLLPKIKRLLNQVRGFFPEPLPQGVTAFQSWAKAITDTYSLPTTDQDSITYALATMIMHLGPNVASKSKHSLVVALRASAAKQVAGACFAEIKERQKAEAIAKAAAQSVTV